jgi:hypothetical protein
MLLKSLEMWEGREGYKLVFYRQLMASLPPLSLPMDVGGSEDPDPTFTLSDFAAKTHETVASLRDVALWILGSYVGIGI